MMLGLLNKLIELDLYFFKLINKDFGSQYIFILLNSITNLADVTILILTIFTIFAIASKRPWEFNKKMLLIITPVLLTAIINIILKLIFQRQGPTPLGLHPWPEFSIMHINYAFPSGHTSRAFALATALSYFFPKHRKILFPSAILIGFSRVYIGAHYPLDVVGGAIVGIAIPLIFYKILKLRGIKF